MTTDEWQVRILEEGLQDLALRTRALSDLLGQVGQQQQQMRQAVYNPFSCLVNYSALPGVLCGCNNDVISSGVTLRVVSDPTHGNVPGHIYADIVVNSDGSWGSTFQLIGAETSHSDWLTVNPIIVPTRFGLTWSSVPFYQSTTWGCGAPGGITTTFRFHLGADSFYVCTSSCVYPLPFTLFLTDSYMSAFSPGSFPLTMTWNGGTHLWSGTISASLPGCAVNSCAAKAAVGMTYLLDTAGQLHIRYATINTGNFCPENTGAGIVQQFDYGLGTNICTPGGTVKTFTNGAGSLWDFLYCRNTTTVTVTE